MAKSRQQIHDASPAPYDTSRTPVRTTTGRWRLQKQGDRLLYVNDAGDVMEVPPPGPEHWLELGGLVNPFSRDARSSDEDQ